MDTWADDPPKDRFRFPKNSKLTMNAPRIATAVLTILWALTSLGCRICADCDLDSYPAYGGAWERTLRDSGRVGSVFDPGGVRAASLTPRTDPEEADARLRRDEPSTREEEKQQEGDLERQFRENQESGRQSEAEAEQEFREMEQRFEDLRLEDIKKINVPKTTWQ